MRSVKSVVAAGAVSLLSQAAFAADLAIAPSPMYAPPPVEEFGGWYLRGDIGMTNQQLKKLDNPGDPNTALFTSTGLGFDSATLFDLGVGYQFNNWFRADVIGQWRGRAGQGARRLLAELARPRLRLAREMNHPLRPSAAPSRGRHQRTGEAGSAVSA